MTFVIVDGPAFGDGLINPEDEIVDVTPTVVSLFGALQRSDFDGVPLTTLSGSDVDPVDLHQALQEQIAMNQYPDIVTNVALSARTIFATLPYYVYTGTNDITAQLQTIVTQNIFLIRPSRCRCAGACPNRRPRPLRGDERPGADRRPVDRREGAPVSSRCCRRRRSRHRSRQRRRTPPSAWTAVTAAPLRRHV